jgi:hypothetical protein
MEVNDFFTELFSGHLELFWLGALNISSISTSKSCSVDDEQPKKGALTVLAMDRAPTGHVHFFHVVRGRSPNSESLPYLSPCFSLP